MLLVLLPCAPALASDHALQVGATILPHTACVLTAGAPGLRCAGADAKVSYRISTGGNGVTRVSVPRGKAQPLKTRAAGGVVTIEF